MIQADGELSSPPRSTAGCSDGKGSSRWLNLTAGVLIAIGITLAFATIVILVLLAEMTLLV
jgi:hypothetical protein